MKAIFKQDDYVITVSDRKMSFDTVREQWFFEYAFTLLNNGQFKGRYTVMLDTRSNNIADHYQTAIDTLKPRMIDNYSTIP